MERAGLYILIGIVQIILYFALIAIGYYIVALWGYYTKDAGRVPKIKGCLMWVFFAAMIIGVAFTKYPLFNSSIAKDLEYFMLAVGGISGSLCLCIVFGLALRKNDKITKISRDKELELLKYRKLNKQLFKQYRADNKHNQNSKLILHAVKKNKWKTNCHSQTYPSEFEFLCSGKVFAMVPREYIYEMPGLLARHFHKINDEYIFKHIDAFCLDELLAKEQGMKIYLENYKINK